MPAVVFIHGIRSDCDSTFRDIPKIFSRESDAQFEEWAVVPYEYDWTRSIATNASAFAEYLRILHGAINGQEPDIYVIAHSMGGLVARRAIFEGAHTLVRRLIMLGTPNFGAVTTAQLGLIGQPAVAGVSKFIGQYLRAEGVWDLTRIPKLFRDATYHQVDTEYVTIPGTFFHDHRGFWERDNFEAANALFGTTYIATELLSAFKPLFRVTMTRPHDGIVEERSCSLFPARAGRWSEKDASLTGTDTSEKTYAHVTPPRCDEMTHSRLACDSEIAALVKELVLTPSISQWRAGRKGFSVDW